MDTAEKVAPSTLSRIESGKAPTRARVGCGLLLLVSAGSVQAGLDAVDGGGQFGGRCGDGLLEGLPIRDAWDRRLSRLACLP